MPQRALLLALSIAVSPAAQINAELPNSSPPLLHGTLDLGLADAVEMALENNLGVQVDRFDPLIAGLDAETAWGAFDPNFFTEFTYLDDKTPNSISFTGTSQSVIRSSNGGAGIRGLVPLLGGEYEARFDGSRTTSNSGVETYSPRFESGWSLSLRQPLLKDLIWNQPWTQVRTTRINADGAREEFRSAVMNLVQSVEDAYWQLSADEEEERVALKSLETADALLDQTRTRFEVGVVSKVEVIESEAGLEARRFNLIVAENRYRNQQDVLIDLVLGPGLHATSTLEIDPTDHPEAYVAYEIDVAEAVQNAFEHRPELSAARLRVENTGIRKQAAWNQRLPELDAVLSYGEEGLSGSQNSDLDCRFTSNILECQNGMLFPSGNLSDTTKLYNDNPAFSAGA
ncbi:MAG: TolC family protein, partial [Myxococcota bacterium]